MDGTAAVSADERIPATASHWGDPRRQILSMIIIGKRKSEELLWGQSLSPDEYPVSSLYPVENVGCSDALMGIAAFFRPELNEFRRRPLCPFG